MSSRIYISALLCLAALAASAEVYGQAHPERRHIRAGNRDYEAQNYEAGEGDYRTALQKDSTSFEAMFNLGDALYKQERFEEAEEVFAALSDSPSFPSPEHAARVFYNLGNAQFKEQKLNQALESYKMSLRINPDDMEAKYNLAYVQKLLEQQQNEGGGGSSDQNEQNDKNDQDSQEQNSGGEGEQPQEPQGEEEGQQGEDEGGREEESPPSAETQPAEALISKEDAEKMLETIQSQEDKTREKVNEQRKATVGRSGKNW